MTERLPSVCPDCGTVFYRSSRDAQCTDCKPPSDSYVLRTKTKQERGYDARWDRLSKRARRLQPFCTDCGSPDDLSGDHTEQAWQRYDEGKTIRLQDIDVVCLSCNSARGAARGEVIGERRRTVDAERLARKDFLSDE